jgi:hypothetical protein
MRCSAALYYQKNLLVLTSVKAWTDPRDIVRTGRIMSNEKRSDTNCDSTGDSTTANYATEQKIHIVLKITFRAVTAKCRAWNIS